MEYAPPDYSFTGLQFNPAIFENDLPTTSTVPDPLTIGQLNTNVVQAKNVASPVTLYTTLTNILTLGSTLITNLYINASNILIGDTLTTTTTSTASNTNFFTNIIQYYNYAGTGLMKILFTPNQIITDAFCSGTTFRAARLTYSNPAVPVADYLGTVNFRAATIELPNSVQAGTLTTAQDLFTTHTSNLTLGGSSLPTMSLLSSINLTLNATGGSDTSLNATSNNGTVLIGNSASTTNMLGYTTINNSGTRNTDIGTGSNTGVINIGNSTSNSLNLTSAGGVTVTRGMNISNGIKMAATNISGVYWKVMYGTINGPAIGANTSIGGQFAGYGASFGGAPQVFVQVQNKTLAGVVSLMVVQVDAVPLASNFYWSLRNNTVAAAAGSYNISWFAIGPA